MKTYWASWLGLNLLLNATAAEPTNAPPKATPPPAAQPSATASEPRLTTPPVTPADVEATVPKERPTQLGGAGPAIVRAKQPLQMLNPAAPREYGDGTQFLSLNPHTGNAEGVTLLSFPLFSKSPGSAKTPKPPKVKKTKAAK